MHGTAQPGRRIHWAAASLHPDSSRMSTTLLQSDLPGLPLRHRGKVRDVFDLRRRTAC